MIPAPGTYDIASWSTRSNLSRHTATGAQKTKRHEKETARKKKKQPATGE
jgi:hypothetical protein